MLLYYLKTMTKNLICLFVLVACSSSYKPSDNKENMSKKPLEETITAIGYREFFMTGSETKLDSVWGSGNNRSDLEGLITAENTSAYAKFLSAEILRHFEIEILPQYKSELSDAYVAALENTNKWGLNGNLWGFLYEQNDIGPLGNQLLKIGEKAVSALTGLLENEGIISYEGSKEAMLGNSYQYRVKDVAAFYLSKITGVPIHYYPDLEERNKEIKRFEKELMR